MVPTDIQHYRPSQARSFNRKSTGKMPAQERLDSLTTRGATPLPPVHCVVRASRTSRMERT